MTEIREDIASCCFSPYVVALGDCLVQLRQVLCAELQIAAPQPGDLLELALIDPEAWARISPLLATVRRAQLLVGRPSDDAPDWLDFIIEGKCP